MTFRPQLDTARDRVRFAVGDTSDPPLMPGGETTYDALLLAATVSSVVDEAAATRSAAAGLAAYYATQPDSISSKGKSLSWSERVAHWRAIALGQAGGAGAAGAVGVAVRSKARRDYTLAAGDVVPEEGA